MIDIEKEKQTLSDSNALGFDQEQNHYIQIGWMKCAESKQAEIDDLKAQINALEESRMTWREYVQKIESGEPDDQLPF